MNSSLNIDKLSNHLKSLTGNFLHIAHPYELLASRYSVYEVRYFYHNSLSIYCLLYHNDVILLTKALLFFSLINQRSIELEHFFFTQI